MFIASFSYIRKSPTSYHGVNFCSHSPEIFAIEECCNCMGAEMHKQLGAWFYVYTF